MSRFSTADFNKENAQRLSVIIMPKLGYPPLHSWNSLSDGIQKKFNRIMNEYIQALPDDWEPCLMEDFNRIVNEEILNSDFDPSKARVQNTSFTRELLLTEEQEEFFKDKPDELNVLKGIH